MSLKTDSKELAKKKAPAVWDAMLLGWEAQLAGQSEHALERFTAANDVAKSMGVKYMPVEDVAKLPLEALLSRIELLQDQKNVSKGVAAPAVLGTVDKPSLTVSQSLEEFFKLTPDRIRGKSEKQKSNWINPRKKAIRNLISVIGDIPIDQVTRSDLLDFRNWWLERIENEGLTPNSANKDLGHISNVLRTVDELNGFEFGFSFQGLRLKEGEKEERLPFSDLWIKERLMAPGALDGLNAEARGILLGMINTGYRPSEAAGLTPDRIRLDTNTPHVFIAPDANRQIKNAPSRREIPLVGVSLEIFREFSDGFPRYRESPATLSATVNKFLRTHGLMESDQHVMYSLRHSFEDRMLRAGIDERVRRELMGHALGRQKYGQGGGLEFKAAQLAKMAF